MKDSSGDWNNTKTFLDAFAETARPAPTARSARTFDVFVGSESFLLANMRNGGVGTISATANVNPAAIHELYAKLISCDNNATAQGRQAAAFVPQPREYDATRSWTSLHCNRARRPRPRT